MADLTKTKHLFFDLDDTLWDFKKNSADVLRELFVAHDLNGKLKTDIDSFLKAYYQTNLQFWSRYYKREIDKHYLRHHRFNECFKLFGYDNYDENLLISEEYMRRTPHGTCLKEDCVEVLEYLKLKYSLHIITNGFRDVQGIKLEGSGIRDYFSHVIISEEHDLAKPDERIFRLAESFTGAEAKDCVMIGDSYESDIAGAVNAGWEAVYFTNDNAANFEGKKINKLAGLKNFF